MDNEIYKMKLHQTISVGDDHQVLRVPGGWIYTFIQLNQVLGPDNQWTEEYAPSSVFVPYSNEKEQKSVGRCRKQRFDYATEKTVRCRLPSGHKDICWY
jgi:hypothetical protein